MGETDLSTEERTAIDELYRKANHASFYTLLGVNPNSDPSEIQSAYYALSRSWHPDRFFRRKLGDYVEKIESSFITITHAYRVLTDPEKRRTYDRTHADLIATEFGSPAPEAAPQPARPEADTEPAPKRKRRPLRKIAPPRRYSPMTKVAIEQVRAQVRARATQARRYYLAGKKHLANGDPIQAASALHLAVRFAPENEEYKALYDEVLAESRRRRAADLVAAAESAESFHNIRKALADYRMAVEYGTDNARAYYRLGLLVQRHEEDPREALRYLRKAVMLDRDNVDYRLALADLYADLDLRLNARREYERVLELDKGNGQAKAGLKRVR